MERGGVRREKGAEENKKGDEEANYDVARGSPGGDAGMTGGSDVKKRAGRARAMRSNGVRLRNGFEELAGGPVALRRQA